MSVVTEDYLKIQKKIIEMQAEWTKQVEGAIPTVENPFKEAEMPLFNQLKIEINSAQYKSWIFELVDYLVTVQPQLNEQFKVVKGMLDEALCKRWIDEVTAFNEFYFQQIAEEHKVAEWIPQFLAEHAIRPYLRAVAKTYEQEISDREAVGGCPCCGEPIRLAFLEGSAGKKVIHCPRCYAHWNEKRLKCSHCGRDNDEKMTYLHVEGDNSMQIHTCQHCNGYVKVIDVRQRFKKEEPALLDLNTIHLDIIAQERGFGVPKRSNDTLLS